MLNPYFIAMDFQPSRETPLKAKPRILSNLISFFVQFERSSGWLSPKSSMAPHVPSELKLDPPLDEEDIGDLSPYLALPSSTSSRASSSTVGSSLATYSPRNNWSDDELDASDVPLSGDITPETVDTPRKQVFSVQLLSPSSPTLSKFPSRPRELARSQTLPRTFQKEKRNSLSRPIRNEIIALEVDPVSVEKMQQWILGIAVGE